MDPASSRDAQPLIAIRGLHMSFGDKQVLRGLDLDVARGETVTVLGPSGCGKSVLLKLVIGLLRADAGEIVIGGEHIEAMDDEQLAAMRQRVGMVFQGAALFDSLSVGENVAYGLREGQHMHEREITQRVAWALAAVSLPDSAEMMPSELSGGMRKRVGIARTIALQPEVVLYDEPTTGLDPINSARIARLIATLQRQLHTTAIVVTHDLATAFTVSDRIGLLENGRLVEIGTVDAIRHSANPHVQAFINGQADAAVSVEPTEEAV